MGLLDNIFNSSEKKEKYVPNFEPSPGLVVMKGKNQRRYVRSPKLMDKHPEEDETYYLQTNEDRGVAMKLFETRNSKLAESRQVYAIKGEEVEDDGSSSLGKKKGKGKKELDVDLPDISKNQEVL